MPKPASGQQQYRYAEFLKILKVSLSTSHYNLINVGDLAGKCKINRAVNKVLIDNDFIQYQGKTVRATDKLEALTIDDLILLQRNYTQGMKTEKNNQRINGLLNSSPMAPIFIDIDSHPAPAVAFEMLWEKVPSSGDEGEIMRMKVVGGWLVKYEYTFPVVLLSRNQPSNPNLPAIYDNDFFPMYTTTFVPDALHRWELKPTKIDSHE